MFQVILMNVLADLQQNLEYKCDVLSDSVKSSRRGSEIIYVHTKKHFSPIATDL